jgi:signal transduction histidine kinase
MADAVLFYDQEGRIVRTNPAFRRLLALDARPEYWSLPLEERGRLLQARDVYGQPLPEDQWLPFRVLRGEHLTGPNAVDFIIRALDGCDVLLNASGAPLCDDEGHIVGGVLILRDVTERRRLERRSQEALDALLAMAETLVSSPAPVDNYQATAGIAQRLADLTRTVLGSQRVTIVPLGEAGEVQETLGVAGPIPAEEQQQWLASWPAAGRRHVQDFLPRALIARLTHGELIPVDRRQPPFNRWPNPLAWRSMLMVPLLLGVRLVGIMTLDHGVELHEFGPDELALARGVARLTCLVLQRERLLREREEAQANALALTEANRRMDEFLAIATHELKTPVTSSSIAVEFAADRMADVAAGLRAHRSDLSAEMAPIQEMLYRAVHSLDRLSRLVVDLLDVSRIRAGKLEMRPALCDLAVLVHDCVLEQRQITPDRTIPLHLPTATSAPVVADGDRIGQVITNYLTNALKYSPTDRPVRVRLQVRGSWARVSVQDNGPGLTPEAQQRVWERFYRVEGSPVARRVADGLGLGLYLCKTIIERHEGRCGLRSAPGKGSVFWFALRLAHPNA